MDPRYLVKRVLYSLFSLWLVLTIVFVITHLLPGSVANIILGQQATEENIAEVKQQLGLDRPLHVQYVDWFSDLLVGDWGTSFLYQVPVSEIVLPRVIRTLQLALVTITVVTLVAIPLGVLAAEMHNTYVDTVVTGLSYVGVSIPSFVTGTVLLLLFTTPPLDFFPGGGYEPFRNGVGTALYHMALPVASLTVIMVAYIMRQTRASMIEALQSDYVRTARLHGVGELRVLFKHALRNGILPTITVIALNFGWLLGSLVIIEQIFQYPGLGKLLVQAISARDLPVIQIAIIIPTVGYILANFLADVTYTVLDPRITLGD